MANVLLIGATGFVGSAVLNELVERGHNVTAVVRNVEKIAKNDLVTAVKEDVANVEAIAKLAEGKDAIISAYNPGWLNPEIATLITENYPKILEAAKKSGLGKDDLIVDAEGNSHISVQDYADAMVNELEKPAHHKERFTIGY